MTQKEYKKLYNEYKTLVILNGELMAKIDDKTATSEDKQNFYNYTRRIYELTNILFGM